MRKVYAIVVCIGMLAVAGARADLISNGSLEGGTGLSDVPSWTSWGTDGALDGTAHEGTQSIKMWFNSTGFYQDFAVTAGESVNGSLYCYTASGDKYGWDVGNATYAAFKLEWFNSSEDNLGGAIYSTHFTPDNAADTWTELTVNNAVAPAGTAHGRMVFSIEGAGPGAGSVLFDSASVTAVPEPGTLALMGLSMLGLLVFRKKIRK
ncbi:MAG: PEP-CTERM sorting domain-containing protein [Kiritimatiellae bacterium]|nr:PEP-CTERM sorting domain-containing protein [Kiritimatiellia bacterium]MDD4736725.1 PEP-CTERM sorting domain-containing protein [Kiritimatiellia bacterium]